MTKNIDYYAYWNKKRKGNYSFLRREKTSLKLISNIPIKNAKFLDAGCGNGNFLLEVKRLRSDLIVEGADFSHLEIKEARKMGLKAKQMNFENGLNFKNKEFNIVYAGELIEHLYNPDLFLSEANRILKDKGVLIITTPNLCAWFNRILMLFGMQPLFLEPSTKSKLVGAGILKKFKKEPQPVGHVRIMTIPALKDLLTMNKFKLLKLIGNPYEEGFPKQLLFLDIIASSISPSLGGQLVLLAQKI